MSSQKRMWALEALALVVITAFCFMCIVSIFVKIPAGNEQLIYTITGALTAQFTLIIGYYFGSSKLSERMQEDSQVKKESPQQEKNV